jgi:hypothetical protein
MKAGQPGGQGGRSQESDQALQAQPTQPGEPLGRGRGGGPRASRGTCRSLRLRPIAEGDKRLGKKIDLQDAEKKKTAGGGGTLKKLKYQVESYQTLRIYINLLKLERP